MNEKTGLETKVPNFKKRFANLHYQSEVTKEFGTIIIRSNTTEDDIMNQYAKLFPKECNLFLEEIKNITPLLHSPSGMSKMGTMMATTKVPEVIHCCMRYLNEDYWMNAKNVYRFIRRYPKFAIGDKK